ncbi:COMM domain-containing protein [Trichostrongylus colubriformis]|uniref:COMM domain-containing protein n=1 Tax=Trichostrongylus colubriformis TaxID=6319 RepID=A0AAN8FAS5_TRICO
MTTTRNSSCIKVMPTAEEVKMMWRLVVERKQMESTTLDLNVASELATLFTQCYRNNSTLPIEKSNVPDEVKQQLITFLQNHLEPNRPEEKPIEWSVNVVVGNNHVKKSLEVITEIELDGEKLEFDVDQFGKLRYQLASAIVAMEKHSAS